MIKIMMCKNCGESSCAGCGKKKCLSAKITWDLLFIGGLNWGLVGLGAFFGKNFNVVNMIFGGAPTLEWIIYILVGIAAVVWIFPCRCKTCMPEGSAVPGSSEMKV